MRFAVVLCLILGCKSQPVEKVAPPPPPPAPLQEQLQPLHPEVIRPGLVPAAGGIALNDYGEKRGELQVRPEREIVTPQADPERQAKELYEQAVLLRDQDPLKAARMFRDVIQATSSGSGLQQKAKSQLAAMGPTIRVQVGQLMQRAYQLKSTNPFESRALFTEVKDLSEESQELYELFEQASRELERQKP